MLNSENNSSRFSNHRLIMVPIPLGELSTRELSNPYFIGILRNTKFWVVENTRTMRRFLSSVKQGIVIDDLLFFELNREASQKELEEFLNNNIHIGNIGVASEAGLPGIADPGSVAALWAHKNGIEVEPLTGPGSIFLAQMASGLNGQQYTFHGYAPIKEAELKNFLAECVKELIKTGYTQIFIETPYRSARFFDAFMQINPKELMLSIACDLHNPGGWTRTKPLREWAKNPPELGKSPCVFLLGKEGKGLNL